MKRAHEATDQGFGETQQEPSQVRKKIIITIPQVSPANQHAFRKQQCHSSTSQSVSEPRPVEQTIHCFAPAFRCFDFGVQ